MRPINEWSQSLFYWIIYSYYPPFAEFPEFEGGLNPYFIGLSILIRKKENPYTEIKYCLNPYFIGLSILIVLSPGAKEGYNALSQSLFYWIIYSYPFCRESPLFIIATEFFSDIKIDFFLIFLVFFF